MGPATTLGGTSWRRVSSSTGEHHITSKRCDVMATTYKYDVTKAVVVAVGPVDNICSSGGDVDTGCLRNASTCLQQHITSRTTRRRIEAAVHRDIATIDGDGPGNGDG